jgi:hypothetical protein
LLGLLRFHGTDAWEARRSKWNKTKVMLGSIGLAVDVSKNLEELVNLDSKWLR